MAISIVNQRRILRELGADEVQRIDAFRREKDTSVLVVVFTDLKGSTEIAEFRGEIYANDMRKRHNDILLEIIERNRQGLYIKNIGDSIMAVFSEPSVAVERALEIQKALHDYNKQNPEEEPIIVRIGMHMGQVAVEDSTSLDVFGRHVNRAARVESLADGGHIYLTYSIYDSARGWIKNQNCHFEKHGDYAVKGIPEPIQIYEVYEEGVTKPKPPSIPSIKQRKSGRSILRLVIIFATLLVIGLIIYVTLIIPYKNDLAPLTPQQRAEEGDADRAVGKTSPQIVIDEISESTNQSEVKSEGPAFITEKDERELLEKDRERARKKLEIDREKLKKQEEKEREKDKREAEKERERIKKEAEKKRERLKRELER